MRDKIHDGINFASKLDPKKIWNGAKLWSSFYISRLWKQPIVLGLPASISIEPTTHCNLRCPQCPSGLRAFSRPTGVLNFDFFCHCIDEMAGTLCCLNFYFQGEPYLHPRFPDMVGYAEGKKIYTIASTNGHFLDEKRAEETVRSGLSRLIISIDGLTQETYEKYRQGGSLEKVKQGLVNLAKAKQMHKSRKPYIIVQFIAMKHNERELSDVKDFARRLGANETKFKTVQVYDHENGSDLIPGQKKLSRYSQGKDGHFQIRNKLYNHCWKSWHSSVITWDGRVVPCCFDKDASYVMGQITDESFSAIWSKHNYQNFRKRLLRSRKTIDICRNCSEGTKVWI